MKDLSVNIKRTKALLIGISDYQYLPKIEPAKYNVNDIAELLMDQSVLGLSKQNIIQVTNIRSDEILDYIDTFLKDTNNIDMPIIRL